MPNWVMNGLTIEGSPEQVKSLMEQMNKPFKMVHDSWNTETGQMEKLLEEALSLTIFNSCKQNKTKKTKNKIIRYVSKHFKNKKVKKKLPSL